MNFPKFILALGLCALPAVGISQTRTVVITGTVSQIYTQPGGNATSSSVFDYGTGATLTFTYDLNAPTTYFYQDTMSSTGFAGYNSGTAALNYNNGAYVVSGGAVRYQAFNDSQFGDYFRIEGLTAFDTFADVDGYAPNTTGSAFELQLWDSSGTYLSSQSLPDSLTLAGFDGGPFMDGNYFVLRYGDLPDNGGPILNVAFRVDSISAIPEPSAFAAIAGMGVLALAATRRRCRNA